MADQETRLRLEMNIEDAASAIDVLKPHAAWIHDLEWYAFLKAWNALIDYVTSQGETLLGPLAFSSYGDFTRLLRKALLSGELDAERYELVSDELLALEGILDELVRETMTNLRYQRPDLNI
jgi:hypothetical protein